MYLYRNILRFIYSISFCRLLHCNKPRAYVAVFRHRQGLSPTKAKGWARPIRPGIAGVHVRAANMRDWWSPASRTAFHARAERVVAQHYGYEPVSGVHLDGRPSLGENLVDLVGATLALDALRLRAVEAGMLRFSRRDRLQLQWIGKVAGRRSKDRPITGYLGISGFHPGGGLLVSDPGTFCRSADCIRPLGRSRSWRNRQCTAFLAAPAHHRPPDRGPHEGHPFRGGQVAPQLNDACRVSSIRQTRSLESSIVPWRGLA